MVSTTGKHSGHGNQHPCLNSAQWLVTVVPSTQVFKSSTVVSPNNTGILKLHQLKVPSANGTCLFIVGQTNSLQRPRQSLNGHPYMC